MKLGSPKYSLTLFYLFLILLTSCGSHKVKDLSSRINYLISSDRYYEAENIVDSCIANDFQSDEIYYYKGLILEKNNNFKNAIDYYNKALCLNSDHSLSLQRLAGIYKKIGEFNQAFDTYSRLILLDSNNLQALTERASIAIDLHRFDLAKNDLIKIYSKDSNQCFISNLLGLAYQGINDNNQAIVFFDKAISICDTADFYFNKSISEYKLAQFDKAKNDINLAVAKGANTPHR